jgi:outer membrane cobalamin receptor/mono/diheme cytochrome c family protein
MPPKESQPRSRFAASHRQRFARVSLTALALLTLPLLASAQSLSTARYDFPFGATIYQQACASCHGSEGQGTAKAQLPLAKSALLAGDTETLIKLFLPTAQPSGSNTPTSYTKHMRASAGLTDIAIAQNLNFVRAAFTANKDVITPQQIAVLHPGTDGVTPLNPVFVDGAEDQRKKANSPAPRIKPAPLGFGVVTQDRDPAYRLGRYVVTSARSRQSIDRVAFSTRLIDGDDLRAAPTATLDGARRAIPGFSLFRRSDSFSANPTAQGVSLRGLGPSGASRSLVLLDGVPLNDPFGGWVLWSQLPRESLAGTEVVRGGGATAWGNAALGGVIQLLTTPLEGDSARFGTSLGSFTTRSAEFGVTHTAGKGSVQLLGRAFTTEGFSLVAPERRGPIDVPAASNHSWLSARWRTPITKTLEATVTARTFEETRHNGTPYQRNGSRSNFASLVLNGQPSAAFTWSATAYAQTGGFSSTFSSVNATRTAETPASDQFAVPSTATGTAWTGVWNNTNGARTSLGVDARTVSGETRENYTYTNGAFTRQRFAGGRQSFAGLYILREQPLGKSITATLGARLDDWRESDGHRRESDRATGVLSRDDHYPELDGLEFSPSAGLVWRATSEWRFRASAQQAFRRPTLNELYRPFRAGSTVTEANPALSTERVTSAELGTDWTRGKLTLGTAVFWNDLRDAVGNVTIARGPGTFPIVGTLAAGGIGRQRLNLDRTRVRGVELSANWRVNDALRFNAEALLDDATVRRASIAPALAGKRVAQVPKHSATLGATWRAPGGITFTPRVRWIGAQFEDDENTLRLGEVVVADLGLSYSLSRNLELFFNVENLGDARIETGRSGDGVVNTGTPRLLLGGLHGSW